MRPFANQPSLTLLPEGAAFCTHRSALIVADLHLGKSATFRARGLPVPEGDTARDLERLTHLVHKHHALELVLAGDMFHAPAGVTPELEAALAEFLTQLAIPVTLVIGNHDAKLTRIPAGLLSVAHHDLSENLRVIHDPSAANGGSFHIAGHWHPVVKIPDGRRASLRLPCFLCRDNTLVLPSFGSFTGGALIPRKTADRVFVAHRESVVELPNAWIS